MAGGRKRKADAEAAPSEAVSGDKPAEKKARKNSRKTKSEETADVKSKPSRKRARSPSAAEAAPQTTVERPCFWLLKSEPDEFSWSDLKSSPGKRHAWDGIRSIFARKHLRDNMAVGDSAFFYHSSCKVPAIVGIAKVVSDAYPDPTQFDPKSKYHDATSTEKEPKWVCRDIEADKDVVKPVTLNDLKRYKEGELKDLVMLRQARLSVSPVKKDEWNFILKLAGMDEQ